MGKRAGGGAAAAAASASSGARLEPAAGRGGGPRSAAAGLLGALHLVMTLVVAAARAEKEAFIQSESIIEVLRFDDGGLLQTETTLGLSSYQQKSISLYRGNCRPIRFEPPMLDFHEQPVGMPKMEKVYLHNPSSEETITLVSISATTSHFHASFFQNRKILPGGNTSFDVVFLARVVGNVENTLFINTSNHGVFTYQVFGVGVPNPYRLRPFLGARVPVNSSFSPVINIHNPHSEPLQVVEMYSSGGDLHLELPTGQQGGTRKLWEIPPYETKGVMRASFSSRDADNHTAFIRIKTNASDSTEFIILPVEVEVTTAPGIYSSTEMLDFGTLRTQDLPKVLNLHLLNSGTKDVPITSVRPTPQNDAITVHFKPVTLKASESKYTKVASISFDASRAKKPSQFSGKITVKAKEKSYSKLEIPYQAEVLDGYLGFDHAATLFHIQDSPADPVERPIYLTNTFSFAILIHDVLLPEEARTMFQVHNFSKPVLILPNESGYIFTLFFMPSTSSMHIDNNILLVTNASKFHLPVRVYTGFLDYFVLPPKIEERFIDFGVLSATEASSILFAIINSNPIELAIKSWHIIGDGLSIELVATERGNRSTVIASLPELEKSSLPDQSPVTLASGHFAVFRVKLTAKKLEGVHDGAIQITTDYEILTIPVKAVVAVGSLTCFPKHMVLPPSFPGKIVHQSLNVMNSFSQKVKIQQIRSLSEDVRFYYRRLRGNREDLEPGKKSKIANIYFDPGLQCGDHCYIGLPFLSKSEPKVQPGVAMQEDLWDADWEAHQSLFKAWMGIKENAGHRLNAMFEVNTDLQKNIISKVSAELSWPSVLSSPRLVRFPLTNTNCSSEEEISVENPADVPVYVQFIPLALYSNPSVFADKLVSRFNLSKVAKLDLRTLEFQVYRNSAHPLQSPTGFTEGLSRHFILNLILKPGEKKSVTVKFTPLHNRTVSSLIIVRNNLTVMDAVMVQGQGTTENLRVAGKLPGPGSSLRFKITEALLKDCIDRLKLREPNFTLKRTFKVENAGHLEIRVETIEISGYACEGYGFKVVNCQEFALSANASRDIVILFTPDFTASRVIRELKFVTSSGSEFVFVLNASLPYHMLAACAEALPRPNWELALYIIISGVMSALFLLVIGTAYLEAQGIWEPFRRRLSFEASNPPFDVGRPFDLRRIVGISSEGNLNTLGCEHSHGRGFYSNSSSRPGTGSHRQCGTSVHPHSSHGSKNSADVDNVRTRNSSSMSSRTSPQAATSQSTSKTSPLVSEAAAATQGHTASRKSKGAKQGQHNSQHHSHSPLEQHSQPPPPVPQHQEPPPERLSPAPLTHPPHPERASTTRHSSEDSDITSLIEAMDKDFEHHDSPSLDVFTEQPPSPLSKNKGKGKSLQQRKAKPPKKQEEKEKRGKGKPQEEELKDTLADDDSSSTTTETSNPDTEPLLREDTEKHKGRPAMPEKQESELSQGKPKSKKLLNAKKEIPTDVKGGSFELPYTPSLENKQRRSLSKIPLPTTLTSGSKSRNPQKTKGTDKLVGSRPAALSKLLPNSQELSSTSSSEGEKDSPPPEWDAVPVHKPSSSTDSLYKLSLQTLNADIFLKQRQTSPTPASPLPTAPCPFTSRGSYSSVVNSSGSDTKAKQPNGSKSKLTKAASLPGKNGNPTFAAVAAGYDKSPGGNGFAKISSNKSEFSSSLGISHIPVDSDGSDSSGLWSPVSNPSSPDFTPLNSFSAFGNSFNLTGVFSKLSRSCSQSSQRSWNELSSGPSYLWDAPAADPSPSWPVPASSSSTTHTATSILGNTSGLWSTTPFSSSIWSSNINSNLPFSTPTNTLSGIGLMGTENSTPAHAPASSPADDLGQTYNPWRIWSPTIGRRSSDPWSNSHFPHEN
ncbi:transmembrane protein 131 isoform X1 [Rattus norvegicus]|uniref:transmembrane protein 131 isoform X1 n=1 Tax=Rattus norvegicus TaxID=10116 RepID=UPI0003D0A98C|nr:transmembrane protein 131 isoform X2 [Rattus norvegicus]|eukprot:XP_006244917.1 PREDICTED: transmembrane protein 131 isoform X2 [Rattus norvegicus]